MGKTRLAGLAWAAAGLLLATAGAVDAARPYQVDDLLHLEDIGAAQFSPDGKRLYFEHFTRFDAQPGFNREWVRGQLRSRLLMADVGGNAEAAPAFAQQPDAGYTLAGLSPDGRRLAYVQTTSDAVRLAVVDRGGDTTRVFEHAPSAYGTGAFHWVGPQSLVFSFTEHKVPYRASIQSEDRDALYGLWQQRNAGKTPTSHAIGSGRFATPPVNREHSVLWDVAVDTATQMSDRPADDVTPSPDGRWMAYVLPVKLDLAGVERLQHGANSGGKEWRLQLKSVTDAGGPAIDVCSDCDVVGSSFSWSPDGHQLLFVAHPTGSDWNQAALHLYDVQTRTLKRLDGDWMPHPGREGVGLSFHTAWLGMRPAVLARPRKTGHVDPKSRADWYVSTDTAWRSLTTDLKGDTPQLVAVTDDRLVLVHDGELWAIDAQGNRRNLTADVTERVAQWQPDPQRTWTWPSGNNLQPVAKVVVQRDRAQGAGKARLWFVDLTTGASRSLELPSKKTEIVAVSLKGERVAVIDRVQGEGILSLLDADGTRHEILRYNQHLRGVAVGKPLRIDHKGPDGDERHSWLLLPPGYRSGTRLATIVNVYPGSVGKKVWSKWDPDTLNALNDHVLAGRGYAVLYPSLPVDYTKVPRDPLNGLVEDVFAAVDAAVAAGYVDPDRLAVQGQSYGGYTAAALVGLTDRFKAAVAQAGPYNLLSLYGTFDERSRIHDAEKGLQLFAVSLLETSQGGMGAPPWDDPERYLRNSPLMHVKDIETPIMLLSGDRDYVPTQQAEEFFTALTRLGKDAVLVRYFGEDHVYHSPANIRDMWRRILDWYEQTLGPPTANGDATAR